MGRKKEKVLTFEDKEINFLICKICIKFRKYVLLEVTLETRIERIIVKELEAFCILNLNLSQHFNIWTET